MLVVKPNLVLTVFVFCFALHLLIDFGFQGSKESSQKKGLNFYMIRHGFKSGLAILPAALLFSLGRIILAFLILFFSHLAIDNLKNFLVIWQQTGWKEQKWWLILGIDQILHLFVFWLLFTFGLK